MENMPSYPDVLLGNYWMLSFIRLSDGKVLPGHFVKYLVLCFTELHEGAKVLIFFGKLFL